MCLVVDLNFHKIENLDNNGPLQVRAFKTLRPLKVYKILEYQEGESDEDYTGFSTPFQYMPVKFVNGKAHLRGVGFERTNTNLAIDGSFTVHRGSHAFYKWEMCLFEHVNGRKNDWDFRIHPAVIPANTCFYIGRDGDIVASRMEVFETEEDFNRYAKNAKNLSVAEEIIPTLAR